jgi:transposase InsO family protein
MCGPLPVTNDGNAHIIVIGDYFTKWKEAYAVPDHAALTVADKIVTELCCRYGCPLQLHSDQGREFESDLFAAVCSKLRIEKTRRPPTDLSLTA